MPRGPFRFNSTDYGLSHVDSKTVTLMVPAYKKLSARQFAVLIEYSDHCFTEVEKLGADQALYYCTENHGGKKFRRMFDLNRWELSRQLPEIIEGMLDRWVYFTKGQNFHIMNLVDSSGAQVEYLIFFIVKSRGSGLRLVVESAYPFDAALGGALPRNDDRVRFSTVLRKVSDGESFRKPSHSRR
jgi:hypothetical protein